LKYVLYNEKIILSEELEIHHNTDLVVYEVIRVIDYIPLFFEDHIERLHNSCKVLGKTIELSDHLFFNLLTNLCKKNSKPIGNIMIEVNFQGNQNQISARFIPHSYPPESDYKKGVVVGFLEAERDNPEAKVVHSNLRVLANDMLTKAGLYEVLLVDRNGFITEGSRSNCFFVKGRTLFSAPLERVLKGITLLKVLQLSYKLGIEVVFKNIGKDEINQYDAVFLTGTSPKILPVSKIDGHDFQTNSQTVYGLIEEYDKLIRADIAQKKEMPHASPHLL
jgi:branched-chain amino acid aminotransferase